MNNKLEIRLADDTTEVRGFGQPITKHAACKMINDYAADIDAANKFIEELKDIPQWADLLNDNRFAIIKTLLDPAFQTVSGVFGKEIIMQILAQRDCEGIRYIVGKSKGKSTIILVGVSEDGKNKPRQNDDGELIAPSKAIVNDALEDVDACTPPDPAVKINYVIAEVHKASLTLNTVHTSLQVSDNPSDLLLASY
ncbi:hypothetical protein [Chitinophaga sp. GbtcB8]|uniref:hypothetical protein n=1 Tax=Chitinophaga sp. GbtcB8 TaxID=2824753 RepID=UPI001C2F3E74|nr:hypothetical protein [Chitinophaga sp. GbtcB8]